MSGRQRHSGTEDRQKTLADGHEQSGRTLPEVGRDRGQAGRISSNGGYPATGAREAATGVDVGRDFDREDRTLGRATGYWQHRHMQQRRIVGPLAVGFQEVVHSV